MFVVPSITSGATPDAEADAVERAKAHAKAGSAFLQKEQYRDALEEFRKAMALKRTRGAVGSVASTLKLLGRYDEALETYEDLLNDFKDLPAPFLAKVNTEITELRSMMGTLIIDGDTPTGAALFVDDRLRGKLPLNAPLRLAQGVRNIRVEKEGFDPITGTVEVVAGQERRLELTAKTRRGRLIVREKHNWPLHVEVDGNDVGVTPWNGLVEPGEHLVRVYGFLGLETLVTCEVPEVKPGEMAEAAESGVKMESPSTTTSVQLYEQTEIVLGAIDTDASLRVDSTPKGALVMIDYGQVGLTPWEGRLPLGEHVIELNAEGFVPSKQTIKLERRKDRELGVVLSRKRPVEQVRFSQTRLKVIFSGFGVGIAGLGTGIITGKMAGNRLDELENRCGGKKCTQAEAANLNLVSALAAASTSGFVIGAAGLALGSISLMTIPGRQKNPRDEGLLRNIDIRAGFSQFTIEGRF